MKLFEPLVPSRDPAAREAFFVLGPDDVPRVHARCSACDETISGGVGLYGWLVCPCGDVVFLRFVKGSA